MVLPTFRDNGPRMQRLRGIFFTPNGQQRLLLPALLIVVVTFAVGLGALRAVQQTLPDEARAAALARTGKFALAEQLYVRLLREKPSVTTAIALVENHQRAEVLLRLRRLSGKGAPGAGLADDGTMHPEDAVMTDEALDELLEKTLPAEVALVTRFWRAVDKGAVPSGLHDAIQEGATKEPPLPWYNHALAREAFHQHDLDEAAKRFEREGLAFSERHEDLDHALILWMEADAWDHVRARMQDARVLSGAAPMTKYRFAVHERDWRSAAKWLAYGWRPRFTTPSLVMTAVAALAWGFFCARLGKLRERPLRRSVFYFVAFVLGVLSVVPTVCLIAVEEAQLRLVATGDATRDILFYVFGVGLREEASKLLLFTPLLFVVRRWGDKLDVLVCGAMVGLGFAAEENLGYLAGGDLHTNQRTDDGPDRPPRAVPLQRRHGVRACLPELELVRLPVPEGHASWRCRLRRGELLQARRRPVRGGVARAADRHRRSLRLRHEGDANHRQGLGHRRRVDGDPQHPGGCVHRALGQHGLSFGRAARLKSGRCGRPARELCSQPLP